MSELRNSILKSADKFRQFECWAFLDNTGRKIRLDNRWDFHYCVEHIRKSERLVKVILYIKP